MRETLFIHLCFDTPFPKNWTSITDMGYLSPLLSRNIVFSDLMFGIGSDIIINDHKTLSSIDWGCSDHLPVHLHTILMSLTAFRKGDYQAYWRNIKSNETEHSESTAKCRIQGVRCQSVNRPPQLRAKQAYYVRACVCQSYSQTLTFVSPRPQTSRVCFAYHSFKCNTGTCATLHALLDKG